MGKASFLDVRDGTDRIQCYLKKDVIGEEAYAGIADLDLGDFLAVSGPLFRTRTQEITVEARSYAVLTKALRPPPEKWHGIEDVEIRYRQRYLDLMSNADVREIFRKRSAIVAAIRRYLDGRGFMEVETPVLQAEAGGAAATPFVTHHRALDQDFFSAHLAGTAPEAAGHRRLRPRVRDEPHLPQRRRVVEVQPRVHDARDVPGVRRLQRRRADGRRHGVRRRARGVRRHDACSSASTRWSWRRRGRA